MSVPKDECYTNLCVRQLLTADKIIVRALQTGTLNAFDIGCENIAVANELYVGGSATLGTTTATSLTVGSASPLSLFEEGTLTLSLTWLDPAVSSMTPSSLIAQYTRINNTVYLTIPNYAGTSGSLNDGFVRMSGLGALAPSAVRSATLNGSDNGDLFNGHTIINTDGTIDMYAGDGTALWTAGAEVIESGTLTYLI